MADWTWTTANALTEQKWRNRWWREAKLESYFYGHGFVGESENTNIIVEFPDLMREQGYQLTFGQIRDLSGAGVEGDATMEGNEEEPVSFDDAITLNQKRNAIRTKGKLSEQYPSDKRVRMWAKDLLKQWKSEMIDQDIFTALGTSITKTIYGGDATATTDIEAGDYFTTNLCSKFKAYSRKATPKIVPKSIKGRKYLVIVISPDQLFDITTRDAAWAQAHREAEKRGSDNRIFVGADFVWDNCIIHTHERIPLATTWGTGSPGVLPGATALGLGIQAGAIAYAKKKVWNEKTFDYGNKVGFCIGSVFGVTKAVFNGADNAVVGIRTHRTNN